MSGSLDQAQGADRKRSIAIVDITQLSASEIVDDFNSKHGKLGWRVVQIYYDPPTNKRMLLAERVL